MTTYARIWQYFAELFLKWEMFQVIVEKIKETLFMFVNQL